MTITENHIREKSCRCFLKSIAFSLFLFVFIEPLASQDSNYWSNQYGTTAELLGGLVVGSIKDLSSTFYNPGAISLSRDEKLSLTTNSFNFNGLNIQNGAGLGLDLSNYNLSIAPSIFAVRLSNAKDVNQFAISYLTRYQFEMELKNSDIDPYTTDSLHVSRSGTGKFYTNLFEGWGGLTWAYHFDDKIGLGITQFIAYRYQRSDRLAKGQIFTEPAGVSAISLENDYAYFNVRTLTKIGAAFNFNPWKLGISITLPSINLFGSGSVYMNNSISNSLNPEIEDYLSSFTADKLEAVYKSPLSIALGASYHFKRSVLHFTGEWFNSVDLYNVIPEQQFYNQSDGEKTFIVYTDQAKSVLNVGLAYNFSTDSTRSYYISITTDRTYFSKGESDYVGIASIDTYYLTLGSLFEINRFNVTLGLNVGYGSDRIDQYYDIRNLILEDFNGGAEEVTAQYLRVKLVFGIGFN